MGSITNGAFRLLLATVLALGSTAVTPLPVAAACNPNRPDDGNYYWMGTSKTLGGITGIESNIRTYSPWVSSHGFSYAWVMLPGSASHQYMQIGPYKSASELVTAVQINNQWPSSIQWNFPATAVGSVHNYQVLLGAPGSYAALLDGQIKISYQLGYTAPGAQIYAEINTLATQLMGDASTKEYFNVNEVRNASRTWVNLTTSISPPTSHFGSSGTGYSFYTWDKCS